MAHTPVNNLNTNPITIEIFNADITVSAGPIRVKVITFQSTAAGDDFALTTKSSTEDVGQVVVHMAQTVNGGMEILDFGPNGFKFDSLYFDTSSINAGLGANDRVQIYLV